VSTEVDAVTLGDVVAAVASGECILFLGAGVHSPPPEGSSYVYPEEQRPPLGSAFSRHLAEKAGVAEKYPRENLDNLQRMSLFHEIEHKRPALVDEIRAAVQTGKKPSPVLRALSELSFPLVITTNFDQLFEDALRAADKKPYVSVYSRDQNQQTYQYPLRGDPTPEAPFVFKIHGDIDQVESIVITDEDYIRFVLRMRDKEPYYPVPRAFDYRFAMWPTLFVGYSLIDYNLRLLFLTLRWQIDDAQIPPTYSVDRYPDPLIKAVWDERRGWVTFIAQDVWTFVPKLYEAVLGKEMPDYRA
jgi:hypothetical protein